MLCNISVLNVRHLYLNPYFSFKYSSGLSFRALAATEMNG
jgi:hypothetical protein